MARRDHVFRLTAPTAPSSPLMMMMMMMMMPLLLVAWPPAARAGKRLRIASANLQGVDVSRPQRTGQRLAGIADHIRPHDPVLFAWQEAVRGAGIEDTSYQLARLLNRDGRSFGSHFARCHLYKGRRRRRQPGHHQKHALRAPRRGGHHAGWLNVRVGDDAQLINALRAHMRDRGATLIGDGFAATRAPTSRRLAFAVCRQPVFCAGSNWLGIYSSHDNGYTPDPELALALAERLRTVITVCCVIDAGGASLHGVVGSPGIVRAFVDEGHSPDLDEMF